MPVGIQASLRALQKRLQACEKSRRRQKVSNRHMKEKLRRLDGNSSIRSGVRHIRKKESSAFALLLDNQLRNSGKKPQGRRFTIEDKLQGISMYQKGPRLYRALMQHMCLPHPESLNSTMRQIELLPGLQPGIKRMLQRMGEKMKTSFRDCILLLDEIHLRHGFTYDKKRDRTIGVVDYDQLGRQEEPAKSALVFMLKSIYGNWEVPIAYFFTTSSTKADVYADLTRNVIQAVHETSLRIRAMVCDAATTNVAMYKLLGAKIDKLYFFHR